MVKFRGLYSDSFRGELLAEYNGFHYKVKVSSLYVLGISCKNYDTLGYLQEEFSRVGIYMDRVATIHINDNQYSLLKDHLYTDLSRILRPLFTTNFQLNRKEVVRC